MNRMSPGPSEVRSPTRSPGRSSTGPDVVRMLTASSFAMRRARVVFPSPGGPKNSVWSSGSRRCFAASIAIQRFLHLRLADELVQPGRAERGIGQPLVGEGVGRGDLGPGVGGHDALVVRE